MADVKVSQLPVAASIGTGDPLVANVGGVTSRVTLNVLGNNLSSVESVVKGPASGTNNAVAVFDTPSGSGGKLLKDGQSLQVTAGKFSPTADTVAGNGMYLADTNTLAFSTNGAERWRFTSAGIFEAPGAQTIRTATGTLTLATAAGDGNIIFSPHGSGNVGIGTTSPSQKLTNVGNVKIAGAQASNVAELIFTRSDFSWKIANETDLRFFSGTGDTDSPPTQRLSITTTGAIQLPSGSPGIVFNAGSGGTSKALDDYEEGTWTPVLTGSGGSAGTYAVTLPAGFYVKVGKLVKATFQILVLTDKGSWSGTVRVSMPFVAVAKNSANTRSTSGIIFTDVHTIDAPIFAQTVNESYVTLRRGTQNSPAWTWASLTTSGFNYISGSIVFETT